MSEVSIASFPGCLSLPLVLPDLTLLRLLLQPGDPFLPVASHLGKKLFLVAGEGWSSCGCDSQGAGRTQTFVCGGRKQPR